MASVTTVTGEIEADQIGKALIHEHVFGALPGFELDARDNLDEDDAVKKSVAALRAVREFGVQTVVDATPLNWYRRPDLLKRISEESEVFIVASTGLYTEHMGWPFHIKLLKEDELAEIFTIELEKGMLHGSIRAGIIKLATGQEEVSKYERRAIVGAVMAQQTTGAGIITHTEGPSGGLHQLDVFEEAGADLGRVMIGHLDNSAETEYHAAIAKRGAFVGFDRIGHYRLMPHDKRLISVLAMIEAGYASQVLLSHDAVVYSKGAWFVTEERPHWQEYGLTFIFRELLPKLEEHGVASQVLDSILVDNPRRVLAPAAVVASTRRSGV